MGWILPTPKPAECRRPYLAIVGHNYDGDRPIVIYLCRDGTSRDPADAWAFSTRTDAWRMLAECYAYHLATDEVLMAGVVIQDYHPKVVRRW